MSDPHTPAAFVFVEQVRLECPHCGESTLIVPGTMMPGCDHCPPAEHLVSCECERTQLGGLEDPLPLVPLVLPDGTPVEVHL